MTFKFSVKELVAGREWVTLTGKISFELQEGSSLCLVGESGCGKTTLLKTLAGILPKSNGEYKFEGYSIPPSSAYVWQELALFPWMRLKDQLCLPLKLQGAMDIDTRCASLLEELELKGLERRFIHELSGGQRQRLALGRALIGSPKILFLDEPFSALDAILRERLQDLLKKILNKRHCTLIMVTHDLNEAVYLGEQILMLGPAGSKRVFLMKNPVYTQKSYTLVREHEAFTDTVRSLHQKMRLLRDDSCFLSQN